MKSIKTTLALVSLLILFCNNLNAQYYTNVLSHYGGTTTHAVKIKTTLPYSPASVVPTVKIEGNDYGKSTKMLLNLTVSWYAHGNGVLYHPVVSSNGSSIPDVYIKNEDGYVTIYLDERVGNQRFNISVATPMGHLSSEKLTGWIVGDEPIPSDAIKVPYGNNFGGKVGINTENPQSELDVNGTITSKGLKVEGELTTSDLSITSSLKTGDLYIMDKELTNKPGYGKRLYLGESWDNSDDVWICRYNKVNNETDLRINIGDDDSGEDNFVIGNYFWGQGDFRELFVVSNNGNVGIGQSSPQHKLEVNGIIRAKGVKMEAINWADFVFNKNYKLPSLSEVENHILENNHLPGIPSEKEVLSEGIDLGEMQAKLLQKIEELTLYAIEQEKRSKEQEKRLQEQDILIRQLQKAMLNKNN